MSILFLWNPKHSIALMQGGLLCLENVREIHSLEVCQGNVREIWSSVQYQGNLTLFTDIQDGAAYLKDHFSSLCHNLFCEIFMAER